MRRLESFNKLGPALALVAGALASFSALANQAGTIPLSTLNGGPSAEIVPSGAGSRVAFFRWPSEVANPNIVAANPADPLVDATQVQVSTTGGIRNRERSLIPANSDVRAAANAIRVVAANTGFANGASAADSYIGFLSVAQYNNTVPVAGITGVIDTIAELEIFFTANPGNRFALSNAAFNGGAGFANGDLDNADLDDGIAFTTAELAAAFPTYGFQQLAVVVFDDRDDAAADLPTEFAEVVGNARQFPTDAAFDANNQIIRIVTNRPIVDAESGNPLDGLTTPAAADFFVVPAGGGAPTALATFLTASAPGSGGVASVSVEGDRNDIIRIDLTNPVSVEAEINAILGASIFFANNDVSSVVGDNTSNNSAQAAIMDRAAELSVSSANLLQGSGDGSSEIWASIDLSGAASNAGDGEQFDLVATVNGVDIVVASGVGSAQFTVPTTGDVPGIDDLNLDGTTTDPVIAAAGTRLFVEFELDDSDDSINSDGTWSDEGGDDNKNREERHALRVVASGDGTSASSSLGGGVTEGSEANLGDLARPQIIGYCTQATGADANYPNCEAVDALFFVFDEAVALGATPANKLGVRYAPGIQINDLTDGLTGTLGLREATTASSSATLSGLISPNPTPSLAEFAISNDSVSVPAPFIPLTDDAADGTTAATGIRPGTGFVGGDSPYLLAADNNLVSTTGVGGVTLGNVRTSGATFASNALTAGGVLVDDCAPAALVAATAIDDGGADDFLDTVTYGMSEDVDTDGPSTSEAESYVFIMDNDSAGHRENLEFASISFNGDNTFVVELSDELDPDDATDPGFVTAIFNPGFTIIDDAGNRIDPNSAKTKMVDIGRPSATFKNKGVATVDPTSDKVVSFMIKTNGQVDINEGGTLEALLDRFYVRGGRDLNQDGDFNDPGESSGEELQLSGLVDEIEIGDEADSDGCYTITLTFMSGMPFPQESFACEYVDADDQAAPTSTHLVDFDQPSQDVPSALISVRVMRAPVIEGDPTSPSGNILTMTIGGTLNLGEGEDALGSEITAWVWKAVGNYGEVEFTYKGVVYRGELEVFDGSEELIANGTTLYFHPQLQGDGGYGTLEPCGVINSCPDLDLYQTITVNNSEPVGGGVFGTVSTERSTPLYQNLASQFVVNPIAIKFARATTTTAASGNVGNFTITGTGISNGVMRTSGRFEDIGSTVVTGEADSNGARPYTLHTYGDKSYKGCPVVLVVCPEEFFTDVDPFLANNLLVNQLLFLSDIDGRAGSTTVASTLPPRAFNINRANIWSHSVDDLVFDDWGIFSVATNNGGFDFGATFPNRFSAPGATAGSLTTVNQTRAFPNGIDARGFFVFLDIDDCEPYIPSIEMALAIDSTGVFCSDIGRLNRIVSGYSYALQFDGGFGSDDYWFTFGNLLANTTGGVLVLANNASNGGWNLTANLDDASRTANSLPGQIVITLDNTDENGNGAGVRIGGDSVGSDFADLEEVAAGQGVLLHQTEATANNGSN